MLSVGLKFLQLKENSKKLRKKLRRNGRNFLVRNLLGEANF
jgi:hypothetical protein